jgi:PAS domain S-box-containing protein
MTEAQHVVRRSGRTEAALLALLEEVARAANQADSLEEAGQLTLDAVCRMTNWPAGHLCLPALDDPAAFVSSGIWATPGNTDFAVLRHETERTRFGLGVGLVGTVARTGAPAWSQDVPNDPNFVRARHGADLEIRSAFAFPVPARDGVAAVLEFFSRRQLPPDPELLRVMGTIGAQLGRVADRVQARRELEAGTRRLEQIIETSAEAFVSIDADGTVTAWNAAAEQMFGLPRELALGQPIAETIIPPQFREAHRAGVARFLATGEKRVIGQRIEISAWRASTGEFPVELAIWALREGERWTFNAFLHDIRDRRRGEEALREAYEQERATADRLRALDQAKDDFVATVSHELRTPLTSLSGYLELLLDGDAGPVPVHQEQMLRTMARNAGRLRALIEDLLLISQMDAGNLRLELEPTSLPGVVARAVHAVTPLARAREQHFEVDLEPAMDPVPADPAHLERALRALLSNAIKFGPDGGLVRVEGKRLADVVELAVIDRGMGIDDVDVPRLFDRFYRTSQAVHEAVQGAGLGLTIARRIIEEHGGTIGVASTPGEGSTFTVTLPAP